MLEAGKYDLQLPDGALRLSWAAGTHRGLVRSVNQDCYRVLGPVFVVCDGMGGHEGGEVASAMVADAVALSGLDGAPTWQALAQSVVDANSAVIAVAGERPELADMGTTLALLAVTDSESPELACLNIGDSRVYVVEDGVLRQVSHDHSVVQELLDEGAVTQEQARTHAERNVLTRVVGMRPAPDPHVRWMAPRSGLRFLLCSDGIFRGGACEALGRNLSIGDPMEAVRSLAETALALGGQDNLVALVVDVEVARTVGAGATDTTVERPSRRGVAG